MLWVNVIEGKVNTVIFSANFFLFFFFYYFQLSPSSWSLELPYLSVADKDDGSLMKYFQTV